ncbi:MAG: ABC transporter permease [Acidobacteriota bacterium]|nr:ABC transporter permease [Acidobacteriota bacterium]MDE3162553.1 ABC transporter permease [Acidobacteriota bacterium]
MMHGVRRLLLALSVVWLVVSLVFLLIHLVPGDPVLQMLGDGASPADVVALRHQLGLDQPLGQQYVNYWNGVLHGSLGSSIRLHETVLRLVVERYPYTIALTLASLVLALALALPAGILAATGRGRWRDPVLSVVSLGGLSVPGLVLGPVLILVFSIRLGWLPVSGASGSGSGIDWRYLVLPAVAMGSSLAAILTRMVRTAMLEELGQDYIRTARAKGLTEAAVVCRHALPNALVPIITVVGLQFGALLAGAVVTETIFSWPGLGRLVVSAIANRDYALVQGCLLTIGLTYVLVNLLTDTVYTWVNPRMRG